MSVTIKDSGNRRQFESGAVRDIADGKGRCDLLPLDVIGDIATSTELLLINEYIRKGNLTSLRAVLRTFGKCYYSDVYTMILEVSKHYEDGSKKYSERNWEKGIPLHCFIDSAVRHYIKVRRGDNDEPHERAFVWNILGAMWTHKNLPEMIDLPFKE